MSQLKYFLERDTLRILKNFVLRFQIQMTVANGVLVPTPYWFDSIEIYIRRIGEEIAQYYNDNLMLFLACLNQEQTDAMASLGGYNAATYKSSGTVQNAGTTRYY